MSDDGFIEPSPVALLGRARNNWATSYADYLKDCPIGKSFIVKLEVVNFATLKSTIYRYGIRHNRKFKAVRHDTCYEIYRKE